MTGGVSSVVNRFRLWSLLITPDVGLRLIAADGDAETQRISESSHDSYSVVNKLACDGRSMLITASVDFVYQSTVTSKKTERILSVCKPEA